MCGEQGLVVWEAFPNGYPDPLMMKQGQYQIENFGKCPTGAEPIKSITECAEAGKQLGIANFRYNRRTRLIEPVQPPVGDSTRESTRSDSRAGPNGCYVIRGAYSGAQLFFNSARPSNPPATLSGRPLHSVCKHPSRKVVEYRPQDGDSGGVYGQFIGTDGRKSGSEFLINTKVTKNEQSSPRVVAHPTYGAFMVR